MTRRSSDDRDGARCGGETVSEVAIVPTELEAAQAAVKALKFERDTLKRERDAMRAVVDAVRAWQEEDEMDDTKAVRMLLAALGRLDRELDKHD